MSIESNSSTSHEPFDSEMLGRLLVKATDLDWHLNAACRRVGTSTFFYEDGERGKSRADRDNAALNKCMKCPVRDLCIATSINQNDFYGYWGASEAQREAARDEANVPRTHPLPKKRLALFYLLSEVMPDHPALQQPGQRAAHA